MSYMVYGYGSYDVPDKDIENIETQEKAYELLHKRINEWCEEHDIDIEYTGYNSEDDFFSYGEEEKGVCIFTIMQVPVIRNKVDEYLWKAKMEMEIAYFASEDYKWTLCDCDVAVHTLKAQEYIDKAQAVTDAWIYEEE